MAKSRSVLQTSSFSVVSVLASLLVPVHPAHLSCSSVSDKLSDLGVLPGTNAQSASEGTAWLGSGGGYVVNFENAGGEDAQLVVWGPTGGWVNVDAPIVSRCIPDGSKVDVSFASGLSGGWAAVFADTTLRDGLISNTWGEYTFGGQYSTFDVSRLVNMSGRSMSIQGSECVSDMTTCVFVCTSGETCKDSYKLGNCRKGSQIGAENGLYLGRPSGGCMVGSVDTRVSVTFR